MYIPLSTTATAYPGLEMTAEKEVQVAVLWVDVLEGTNLFSAAAEYIVGIVLVDVGFVIKPR